ncbi:D-arabitol-phosphate dehydrogenase [bioreactor metagenome]|uniref:D-arabitol-phosphate dehydrogenase n=1 Tax=bioreactor metagenome TaxID=1076179 RepID=A0A645CYV7_9ZZZZ
MACGIHATNIVGDVEGKTVVVIGPGIIGLSAFFAAKLKGAAKILVVGIGTDRRALIEKNGGEYFDTAKGNLLEYVEKWTDGNLADVVYECVGIQPTLNNAIVVTKPGGKIMVMGVFEKPPVVDLNTLQEAERTILTSQAHIDEIATALEYIRDGKINTEELVTGEVTQITLLRTGLRSL